MDVEVHDRFDDTREHPWECSPVVPHVRTIEVLV